MEESEIQHITHRQHDLLLLNKEDCQDANIVVHGSCSTCGMAVSTTTGGFKCNEGCDFYLHQRCARLLSRIHHAVHEHPLELRCHSDRSESDPGSYCNICKQLSVSGFFYSCNECDFKLDWNCFDAELGLRTPVVRFEYCLHKYILFGKDPIVATCACEVCNSDSKFPGSTAVFSCVTCPEPHKRHVHCLPVIFPGRINHKSHYHTLEFAESFKEDDTGEYYCDVCEKLRDPDHPVYHCKHHECSRSHFIAHLACVLHEELPPLIGKVIDLNTEGEDEPELEQLNKEIEQLQAEISHLKLKCENLKQAVQFEPEYSEQKPWNALDRRRLVFLGDHGPSTLN